MQIAFENAAPASRWGALRLYLAVFSLFFLLYGLTAQQGPAWQDSGAYQYRIVRFEPVSALGIALSHPLLIAAGKLFTFFPAGPVIWRMNLLSAFCGAVAAANIACLVRRLAPSKTWAPWLSAMAMGLAHTNWWLATITESQMVFLAVFTAELHVLVSIVLRPRLLFVAALGLLNGLALSAHNLALLALPAEGLTVIYLCAKGRLRWFAPALMVACWLAGASSLLAVAAYWVGRFGPAAALQSMLFGESWRGEVLGGSARALGVGFGCVLYNFPNLVLPLAVVGLWNMRRRLPRATAWAFAYLTVAYFVFAVRYAVPDQFMFFTPLYAMVALLAGLGAASLKKRAALLVSLAFISVLINPAWYAAAPAAWQAAKLPPPGRTDLPFRDAARYWLVPWKHNEDSAGDFARAALVEAPPGSTLIAGGTSYYSLALMQELYGLGDGVRLLKRYDADEHVVPPGTADVFTVSNLPSYYPRWMEPMATFVRNDPGILYRVVWKSAETIPAGGQEP